MADRPPNRNRVDVLTRYSNEVSLSSRWQDLTEAVAGGAGRRQGSSIALRVHKLDARIDGELAAHLVAEYEAGTPSTHLTAMFGLAKGSVLKVLREAGVERRLPRMSQAEIHKARRLYESGLSLVEVSKRLGRPGHSTVYQALKRAGVRMRDSHGRAL